MPENPFLNPDHGALPMHTFLKNESITSDTMRKRETVELMDSGALPGSGFRANAVYLLPSTIACNLPCLMRQLLPAAWYGKRAVTFRHRLYAMADSES